jgi:hypothetical protein
MLEKDVQASVGERDGTSFLDFDVISVHNVHICSTQLWTYYVGN